ncbi:MAG: flagellar basal body-associated protein FliL [Bacillus sp. (in: firmicutes)]
MKNKALTIMLLILVSITLVGVIALVLILNKNDSSASADAPSADQIVEASVVVPEVTTNLADGDFVKMAFTIQTSDKKAKEELEKRLFQVNNIIITELSELNAEQLQGKQGKEQLQSIMKQSINGIMQEGTVEKVYITSSIIQ